MGMVHADRVVARSRQRQHEQRPVLPHFVLSGTFTTG
jgi:hypothetical protein